MVQSREQSWAPGEGMGGGQPSGCHSPCCPPTFPEHRRVTSRHAWSVSHYYGSHAWPRYAHCVRGWGRPKETQPKHGVSEDGIVRVTVSMGLCAGPTLGQMSLRACVREPAPFGAHPLPWGPGDKGRGREGFSVRLSSCDIAAQPLDSALLAPTCPPRIWDVSASTCP